MPFRTCIEPRTISHLHATEQHKSIKQFTDTSSLAIHGVSCGQLVQFFLRRLTLTTILCSRRGIVTFMRRSGLWPAQPSDQANHVLVTFTEPTAFWKKGAHCSERSVGSESSNTLEVPRFHAVRFVYCINIKTFDCHLSGCSPIYNFWGQNRDPSLKWHETPETPETILESENPWKFSGGWVSRWVRKKMEVCRNDLDFRNSKSRAIFVAERSLQKRTPAQIVGKFSPNCRVAMGMWPSCVAGSKSPW